MDKDRKPLTADAQQAVDDITKDAGLTPEPTKETPKLPVKKKSIQKAITHLENIPTKGNAPMKMYGKSPAKKYGHSPMKETAAQEKKNLMTDMPVDEIASALKMKDAPSICKHMNR